MTEKLKRKLGHNNLFWRSNKLGDIDIAWRESEMCGHIWRTGFECHELKSVVFEDVPEALEKWHSSGIKFTYIQVVVD
ncbi:unnamed protein product [Brassica rapa]|uniref:Uncharacterized protein n=2 Tax=Brassica TaxID=3705 RepID=A0A8D9I8A3_BRACM|nr:unnamed protein product [Brassica napus]CAG7912092.1 unnamed protein product [Brassica rapa]